MGCPAFVLIGKNLVFSITTHDPDTGVLTDADAVPDYWIYEDETGTSINANTPNADNMAKLDDAHTTGFYTETITCSAGNGYEDGKTYTIYIEATVGGDKGGISYAFTAYSATRGTAGTALPDAAADGAGGLPISDAGGLDLDTQIGTDIDAILTDTGTTIPGTITTIDTVVDAILVDTGTTLPATLSTIDTVVDAIKAKTDNLPSGVAKNVALSGFSFMMYSNRDHVTPATGLTVTCNISQDTGAFAASTNSVTEISDGAYYIDLTQAEMNADVIVLLLTASGADTTAVTIVTDA